MQLITASTKYIHVLKVQSMHTCIKSTTSFVILIGNILGQTKSIVPVHICVA